jgi:thioredoxin-related protein
VKNLVLTIAAGLGAVLALSAQAETPWLTDYKKAQEQAKSSNKLLLLEFTGSDWCPPCRMLQKEVLSTPEFKDLASKNFVLVEIDFPRTKEQSRELVEQNQMLAQRFGIQGFPSIIILNTDGKKLGELVGYDPRAGWKGYIESLEKIRKG